ncbi:hydroxysqualene dehydroxylase HpnE [Kitasatospora kifunensis]|uniref:Squalene-associated FAD-dependent desaturase n=1 Tax=Kitasatospora kifunensis TaxID=58351 RepID=A0A7W7QYI2_KITKI|nr:hydroxysqualene dehydroxylase HpnE [Kitasatospora kifunensis]MBB4921874.1 squalene-associated FAD-dependent desaturase [Kitasatospora kifunensis]
MSGQAQRSAVVVGGGLAGLTAALRLAEAGHRVTLLEARPRLGGLAFSFRRGELTVDNGQHVFLRCCTAYRGLIERLGAGGQVEVQPRLDVPVLAVRGDRHRLGRLRRAGLPVPLHLAASLATYPHLRPLDRLRVVRGALALQRLDLADPALDQVSFGSWLRSHGQNDRTIAALWDLVGVATLNAKAAEVSLALAAMVFKTGLLTDPGASDIGIAAVPLGALHHDAALAELTRAEVTVRLRTKVVELKSVSTTTGPPHAVRLENGELLNADVVVLAGAQDAAAALLPPEAIADQHRLGEFGTAPILNVHVIYDRKVLRRPFFAALDSPVQWVFDRTPHSGVAATRPGAQYLALSQSAVREEIDLPVAELRARYLPELERLLPAARTAEVLDFFVTRERTATFDPAPGTAVLRPTAATRIPGLLLAGSWTATGWPATMESAVRSGHAAADAALRAVGQRVPVDRGDGRWPR